MNATRLLIALGLTWAVAAAPAVRAARAEEAGYLSIGTGQVTGVYYPVGRELCRIWNATAAGSSIHCGPEATPGSIYNLEKLREGELEFALVQSDTQADAVRGRGAFSGRAARPLRSVASLHAELMTVVVRKDSGLRSFEDLKRKRVNAGAMGSGSRTTWNAFEVAAGWSADERSVSSDFKPDVALNALCAHKIDATLLLVGHPSAAAAKHLEQCETTFLPIQGPVVDKIVQAMPQFRAGAIPGTPYGLAEDVPSFGVRATLVTNAATGDDIVFRLTKAMLADIEQLRQSHPALSGLDPRRMASDGLTAPLHPGAIKAYRDAGVLQ